MSVDTDWIRRIALRPLTAVLLIVVVLFVVAFSFITFTGSDGSPSVSVHDNELVLSFGLSREPITRLRVVDLCALGDAARPRVTYPECAEPVAAAAGSAAEAPVARPEVRSAGLEADLQSSSTKSPGQFPAGQVTVAATNEGARSLRITVTGDPRRPERVKSGSYGGRVIIERATPPSIRLELTAQLDPKTGRPTNGRSPRFSRERLLEHCSSGLTMSTPHFRHFAGGSGVSIAGYNRILNASRTRLSAISMIRGERSRPWIQARSPARLTG